MQILIFRMFLTKNKIWYNTWFINILSQFFAPKLFSVEAVSFSTSFDVDVARCFKLILFLQFDHHLIKEAICWQGIVAYGILNQRTSKCRVLNGILLLQYIPINFKLIFGAQYEKFNKFFRIFLRGLFLILFLLFFLTQISFYQLPVIVHITVHNLGSQVLKILVLKRW